MKKQVGQTKSVGFQFGIRKTYSVSAERAWEFLFSVKGLNLWLGKLKSKLELHKEFETENGISGNVGVFKPNSHIRIKWKKQSWTNMSTVQLRVIEKPNKTTIAIHQEKLLNVEQRLEMKAYWTQVMKNLEVIIE